MKSFKYIMLAICTALAVACSGNAAPEEEEGTEKPKREAVKVIFETDMCFDVDDVAALALLHVYQTRGRAEILAVSFNEVHRYGVAAIDAINTYYNRPDIPIGMYKGNLAYPDASPYLFKVSQYPNDTPKDFNKLRDSQDVYVEALSNAPDHSVKIVSVGFMNNLADLLRNHKDLVAKKVKELIFMGGINGDDFNLVRHNTLHDTEYVLDNWPTKIIITQNGHDVLTGRSLERQPDSPIRAAFKAWFGNANLEECGRCSWDSMAALYAVEGDAFFEEKWDATIRLTGGKAYPMHEGKLTYIDYRLRPSDYEKIIDSMLLQK